MKAIRFVPLVVLAPLLLATTVLAVWMVATVWATFNPTADIVLSSYNAGDNADITSSFEVPAGDVYPDAVVTYTPPEWVVAAGEDIPLGDTVGVLTNRATLGLTFTACNIRLPVNIDLTPGPGETRGMINASTDTSDSFPSTGRITLGPYTASPNKWNGYDIMPSGNYRAVDQYPSFLNDLYPVEPRARYFGVANVPAFGNLWVVVQLLVFEPGANIGPGIPNSADWGYGSVTVLNDPTLPPDPSGSLGDLCAPFSSEDTVFGETEDGDALRTNPQYGGTYTFRTWSRGLPDADGDGLENALDTCPFDAEPPIVIDNDGDGIGPCDPDPTVPCWPGAPGTNDNCDADLFANRADNCPLIANNDQADEDFDDIGDVCDTRGNGPGVVDGDRPEVTIETPVEIIGPPPPASTDYAMVNLAPPSLSFANPGRFGVKLAVYSARVQNVGAVPGDPASLSLRLEPVNATCRAPLVFPISPYSLTLDPGNQARRAWLVLFSRCGDPSPPVDYIATATISAPGDSNPDNDALSATVDVRRR